MAELNNEPLTFEKVWAALMENREQMKESDRKFQAMSQETDRKFQAMSLEAREQMKETREQMKETDRRIGELGNRFGDLAEHLVLPGIMDKFNALGFQFTRDAQNAKFRDPTTRRILAEIDILLENGDIVIAVEVKSTLRDKDVDKHLERMEFLRSYADSKNDKRKYRGAIAAAIVAGDARSYALESGFYVIEQSGDTMKLDLPEGFIPREW